MSVTEWLRAYCVLVMVLNAAAGSLQWRRWQTFMPENQLAWLAVAALNVTIGLGSLEAMHSGAPGGIRNYLAAVAMTWLLSAVLYRPWLWAQLRLRHWRRGRK